MKEMGKACSHLSAWEVLAAQAPGVHASQEAEVDRVRLGALLAADLASLPLHVRMRLQSLGIMLVVGKPLPLLHGLALRAHKT